MLAIVACLTIAQGRTAKTLTPESLRATVEKLASWRTRNTSSSELNEVADWLAGEYRKIPGMQVEIMRYQIRKGPRIPADKDVVEVVATLPPNKPEQPGIVLMGGHIDTINMGRGEDPMTARAPGANDDGSGSAATLDVARFLADKPRSHTLVFAGFSGEEQGLLGSEALAARAEREGWRVDAVLSNDMIGNSHNLAGQVDDRHVRLFSEESPKHNSRELGRWIEWLNRTKGDRRFGVKLVFRPDRFGRGGDHTPFNRHGFNAIRLVEMHEEYSRQHTPNDLPDAMDFDYLARNAKLNALAVETLANAGLAPSGVRVDRRQNHDTMLTWRTTPGTRYMVYWRDTTEPTWTHWKEVGDVGQIEFKMLSKDENVFAVGAVGGVPIEAK
ncbi:MAG TPA: M20/M25/M40 family metallo-hydrolase [Fimbriimonas sp.]|nr:M20/M25/M40 family metallo-hydrolase [Fimbriimonas sp.]